MTKTVFLFDENGCFIGNSTAYESPLETGVFYMPEESTEIKPLEEKENYKIKWNGKKWVYEEIPKEPEPEAHIPTIAEIRTEYDNKLTDIMNAKAQEYNYGGILSAISYKGSSIEKFDKEGTAFSLWRDEVLKTAYAYLAEVDAGTKQIPATEAEFLALIPKFSLDAE